MPAQVGIQYAASYRFHRWRLGILDRPPSRTMTNEGDLATRCARGLQIRFAPKERGRREDRVRAAPAVSCAQVDKKTHMSIQVERKQSGLPCAMVLRLISCSPRRDLACLPPSPARSVSFSRA